MKRCEATSETRCSPSTFGCTSRARFGPGSGSDPSADTWELYYLPDDFSQAHDVAAQNPEKVTELAGEAMS